MVRGRRAPDALSSSAAARSLCYQVREAMDGGLNSHVSTVAQFRAMASRTW